MSAPTSEQFDAFAQALGDEIRATRRERGWTRKQLQAQLSIDVSLQSLATYELGTRRISVERLVELALALDEPAAQLLSRATTRTFASEGIAVDLSALVSTEDPRLIALRPWAALRICERPADKATVEELDPRALAAMAAVAGTTLPQVIDALHNLQPAGPRPAPSHRGLHPPRKGPTSCLTPSEISNTDVSGL